MFRRQPYRVHLYTGRIEAAQNGLCIFQTFVSLPITRICGTKRHTCDHSQMLSASYSIVRMSEKPVTSKISIIVSLTWTTFISPCLFMVFWAESSTRSPAEEM